MRYSFARAAFSLLASSRIASCGSAVALAFRILGAPDSALALSPNGSQFQVNTYTTGLRRNPAVAERLRWRLRRCLREPWRKPVVVAGPTIRRERRSDRQ